MSRHLVPVVTLVLFAAGSAEAQELFGAQGQLVPGGSLSFSYTSTKPPEGDSRSSTALWFGPQALFFVADYIAVGGALRYHSQSSGEGPSETSNSGWSVMPMGAANIPFVDFMSLFIQLGVAYGASTQKIGGNEGGTRSVLSLNLFVPLLFHPVSNFFIGVGPALDLEVLSKVKPPEGDSVDGRKDTTVGLGTIIGGYI
jgi:opacity protein-like surface antigen